MDMMWQGPARSRWVSLLVVVLALTASRANFPLLGAVRSGSLKSSAAHSLEKGHQARKPEGVIPSRRALESRKLAQVDGDQADAGSRMPACVWASEFGDALGAGRRAAPPSLLLDSATRPRYLGLYFGASSISALPPPA